MNRSPWDCLKWLTLPHPHFISTEIYADGFHPAEKTFTVQEGVITNLSVQLIPVGLLSDSHVTVNGGGTASSLGGFVQLLNVADDDNENFVSYNDSAQLLRNEDHHFPTSHNTNSFNFDSSNLLVLSLMSQGSSSKENSNKQQQYTNASKKNLMTCWLMFQLAAFWMSFVQLYVPCHICF